MDCPNEGCDVKIQRRLLENHKIDCHFKKNPCQYCGAAIQEPLLEVMHGWPSGYTAPVLNLKLGARVNRVVIVDLSRGFTVFFSGFPASLKSTPSCICRPLKKGYGLK